MGSSAAFPACRQCAEPAPKHSSKLDRQMDTLGSSTCDCWVQEATSRCSHTTGCSQCKSKNFWICTQQVLQDGKSKTQRSSKTEQEQGQDHVHSQGCCVGSREPKGSRAPSSPGAAPGTPLQLLYEEGGLLRVCPGVIHCNPRVFACPTCACFPLAPFPGREPEKGQYSRLWPGKQ